jgi:hypothetical protein
MFIQENNLCTKYRNEMIHNLKTDGLQKHFSISQNI